MAIGADQWADYERDGVIRVAGAIPRAEAEAMVDRIWATLGARHDIRRDDPATWTVERPAQFQALGKSGAFEAFACPAARAGLDRLLGAWVEPDPWGIPLVSFPTPAAWALPHRNWHLDITPGHGGLPGRVFAILAPSRPRGGGTLYVEGSHHLVAAVGAASDRKWNSASIRARLTAEQPWLAALWSRHDNQDRIRRFMDEGVEVEGVRLRVREMTGEPGDILFMHPLMLHASSPNALDGPRMMLTQFVYPKA